MINSKRIQQLDLNLLRVFQTLYQEQNMTRTAELLNITPSAVSHAMKRLRQSLDDPLFQRTQNRMVPTASCQRMAPLIIDNLTRLQQILQQWGDFEPTQSEYGFRIGMHDALEPAILPKLVAVLSRRAPKVSFSSIKVSRNMLSKELSSGHIDLALDISMPTKSPVKQKRVWSSNFVVLMRKDHPLSHSLSKKDYMESQHISVSNRPQGMTMEDTFFTQQGLERKTSIRCQNYFAACEIVKSSTQLLTVTEIMAEQLLDENLCMQSMPFSLPSFATSIYWHQNTEHDPALAWLRSVLIELEPIF